MSTTTPAILPFEGPVQDLDNQIDALQAHPDAENMADEIASLRENRRVVPKKTTVTQSKGTGTENKSRGCLL